MPTRSLIGVVLHLSFNRHSRLLGQCSLSFVIQHVTSSILFYQSDQRHVPSILVLRPTENIPYFYLMQAQAIAFNFKHPMEQTSFHVFLTKTLFYQLFTRSHLCLRYQEKEKDMLNSFISFFKSLVSTVRQQLLFDNSKYYAPNHGFFPSILMENYFLSVSDFVQKIIGQFPD